MVDETGSKALAALRGFMAEMNAWEVRYYPLVSGGKPDHMQRFEEARCDLRPIYDRYVTSRERKMGRLVAGPSLGSPPEFDPERESVETVEVAPRKVVISTRQGTGFEQPCRYTMVLRGDRWLLDRKEHFYVSEGEWRKALL